MEALRLAKETGKKGLWGGWTCKATLEKEEPVAREGVRGCQGLETVPGEEEQVVQRPRGRSLTVGPGSGGGWDVVKYMAGDRALPPVMHPGGVQRAEGRWLESHQSLGRAELGQVAAAEWDNNVEVEGLSQGHGSWWREEGQIKEAEVPALGVVEK